jgi:signal transduction histidine kinase
MLRQIGTPACALILALVAAGAGSEMVGKSAPVIAAAAVALTVAIAGIGWVLFNRLHRRGPDLVAQIAAGLGGAALIGLLPSSPGYLVIFVVLISLGLGQDFVPALTAALVVLAASNLAGLLAGELTVGDITSDDIGGAFFFAIGAFTRSNIIAKARAEELLAELRASQAAQAKAAALTERTRLAREVHDILAHALSGLVLALNTAELLGRKGDADVETMARMLEQVTRAQRIARDGLADTRRAISALRGDELPGPALLDRLVRQTSEATGMHATLTLTGEQRPLPPEIGLALYRTAQEALINSAKYAGRGGSAELRLAYSPDSVELEIEDVRSPDAAPPQSQGLTFGGYGLTGMRERAELLGGQLTAGPTEQGFRVLLRLPTSQVPREAEAV